MVNDTQLHTALHALAADAGIPAYDDAPEFATACAAAARVRVTALDGLARRCALRGENRWAVYYRGLCDDYQEILDALTAPDTAEAMMPT